MSTGKFCWFDLMSNDVGAARAFYGALFGWDVRAHGDAYHMIHDRSGRMLGGMMAAQPGMPSAWLAYVTTDDIVGTTAKVRDLGGKVFMAHEAEGVGKFAIFADPQGAAIAAIQLADDSTPYPREKAENHISWAELHTADPKAAVAFYVAVFGWRTETWGDDYTMVGDEHAGGIMKAMQPGAPPHWLIYVNTEDTDASTRRVAELGGRVLVQPTDIPHVGRFAVFADSTGAAFAVMQSARRE